MSPIKQTLTLGYMPDGTGTVFPFNETFKYGQNVLKDGFDGVDALVLWGGEDIAPIYYNETRHPKNQNWDGVPSKRDANEWKAMQYAKMHNIPIIGVCRGAQFLCAFSGGTLIQHTTGHHQNHLMTTSEGEIIETSSCHHQMMYPFAVPNYELLAWSTEGRSTCYEGQEGQVYSDMKSRVEVEVVYFPQTRGLAIQGHPEWCEQDSEFARYCNRMVRERLLIEETEIV